MTNEPRTCPNCGIFYYEWLQQDFKAVLGAGAVPEPLIPNIHACPEPYPYEHAVMLHGTYAAAGMPVSQRVKARIMLGLRAGPRD
jgi:hypothetical protein